MNRLEALKIGKIIADRWHERNVSTIRSRQHIERQKLWHEKTDRSADKLESV